jgi:hypothetical protein
MVFKSGTSGNPGGARKTKPFHDALRMEIAAAGEDNPRALRAVARALLTKAASGDVAAIQALADRLDGKVPQPTGGSDELGPQRLQICWKTEQLSEVAAAEAASSSVLAVAAPVAQGGG